MRRWKKNRVQHQDALNFLTAAVLRELLVGWPYPRGFRPQHPGVPCLVPEGRHECYGHLAKKTPPLLMKVRVRAKIWGTLGSACRLTTTRRGVHQAEERRAKKKEEKRRKKKGPCLHTSLASWTPGVEGSLHTGLQQVWSLQPQHGLCPRG